MESIRLKALQRLKELGVTADSIDYSWNGTDKLMTWRLTAESALRHLFDEKSVYLSKFESISWSLRLVTRHTTPQQRVEQFLRGLSDSKAVLSAAIQDAEDYGVLEGLNGIQVGLGSSEKSVSNPTASLAFDYDVALSFAGEDRRYVEEIASQLRSRNVTVFYDRYEQANLWGKELYVHLDEVYRKRARYCMMFLSESYASKVWTSHERKSAQARAMIEKNDYLLPVRLDDTEIPGMLPTVGYIKSSDFSSAQIVELVIQKLHGGLNYAPAEPTVGLFMDIPYLLHAAQGIGVGTVGRALLSFAEATGKITCAWAALEPTTTGGATIAGELKHLGFSLALPARRGQSDFALLERITEETIRDRVGTFILATGDGDYLDKVMSLLVLGHPVHLVANLDSLYGGYANLLDERRRFRTSAGLGGDDFFVHELPRILAH